MCLRPQGHISQVFNKTKMTVQTGTASLVSWKRGDTVRIAGSAGGVIHVLFINQKGIDANGDWNFSLKALTTWNPTNTTQQSIGAQYYYSNNHRVQNQAVNQTDHLIDYIVREWINSASINYTGSVVNKSQVTSLRSSVKKVSTTYSGFYAESMTSNLTQQGSDYSRAGMNMTGNLGIYWSNVPSDTFECFVFAPRFQ